MVRVRHAHLLFHSCWFRTNGPKLRRLCQAKAMGLLPLSGKQEQKRSIRYDGEADAHKQNEAAVVANLKRNTQVEVAPRWHRVVHNHTWEEDAECIRNILSQIVKLLFRTSAPP